MKFFPELRNSDIYWDIKSHIPVNPGVSAAIFLAKSVLSKSVFSGCKCTLKMDALPLISGAGTKICRSNLPGRSKALSKMSTLFVAARTTTLVVVLKPTTHRNEHLVIIYETVQPSSAYCSKYRLFNIRSISPAFVLHSSRPACLLLQTQLQHHNFKTLYFPI